jgi:hypothetical protein
MDPLHLEPHKIETTAARSAEQNSWGALIAIVVIMAIVVVGAFYAWGKRVAQEHGLPATVIDAATTTDATTTDTK